MPTEPNYFGLKLGEALAGASGTIGDAYSRRKQQERMEQMRNQELARQQEQQDFSRAATMAGMGIDYDPTNPMAALQEFSKSAAYKRAMDMRKAQAEIDALNRRGQPGQDVPAGYRYTQEGTLQPIEGGPAYQKQQQYTAKLNEENQKKAESQLGFIENIDNALAAIDKAKKNVGYLSTGVIGGKLIGVAPSAGNLKADIDTINSFIGIGKLMEMKNASKMGASGFGALSEKELALLTASIRSLDQKLVDPNKMRENLDTIAEMARRWKERTLSKMPTQQAGQTTSGWDENKEQRYQELKARMGQ